MISKEKRDVADLLQRLSNAIGDREGDNEIHQDNDNYINGVKKSIPEIEKALKELKLYFK